jgi:DNA mismatch repair protein MutL
MGIINILDTQTANMIAAGEVVEKPASAVKELIENSIDAGATHIICEIRGGGNSFIRISDNGKGISGDDLPKAILPHATSKISNANDIDGILTLGFRGEALAAISSVSRLEILSKQKNSDSGHKLTSDENGVDVCEEGVPDGTVITVRDLFYNVPARRKFMRKDSSEASAIGAVITKASLSHPEISFKMISEGAVKFITPGDGDLYSAIYATLGKDFAKALTPVAGVHGEILVGGYISKPGES